MTPSLVLASSSPARRLLLDRLGLPYQACPPDIDETRHTGEAPADYVGRLAQEKAAAVAERFPGALVIGSDQAALLGQQVLGKPGDHERALAQLEAAQGQRVEFLTGLCLLDSRSGRIQSEVVSFRVHFRQLPRPALERYLRIEQPYGCAGSFKSEGLGISLFERLEGDDPTALVGLPLIRLVAMLAKAGIHVP